MAVQRAQRNAMTSAELASSHPARTIQTCQPLYLSSAATTNHCSKLSAHKQSSSQILSSKKVRSSDAYLQTACAAEIGTKKLQIHLLPDNKSSEDIFADLASLRNAVRNAFEKLVSDETRVAKEGVNITVAVGEVAPSEKETLG